ncbi:SIMPL domain-containing protein [Halalkalibacterium halodurans]|nr:SIMPL domain-containing protein [Halalkalibacterium halodurans]
MIYHSNAQRGNRFMTNEHGRLTVVGEGKVTVQADVVVLSIGVSTTHSNVEEAVRENNERAQAVVGALQRMRGVEQIETLAYSVSPIYEFVNGEQIVRGYSAVTWFDVTVDDLTVVGEVYAEAFAHGANETRDLRFKVSDEEAHYQQALQLAVRRGYDHAQAMAGASMVELEQPPVNMRELIDGPVTIQRQAYALAATVGPPIEPQQMEIVARVKLEFSYDRTN